MVRGKLALEPLIHGGGQERGRRSGTENVAGAVSTATALSAAAAANVTGAAQGYGRHLIDVVLDGLNTRGRTRAKLTGDADKRVPGIVSFVFPETGGETVLLELERRGVLCSSGSACAAGSTEASSVLMAMGYGEEEAHTAVRLSFTRTVKESEIATAARAVVAAVKAIAGE